MALTINCPNCGGPVVFRSAALPAVVCSYCNSMLARSDAGVAVVGVSAPLPFDVSPIQLGVRGRFESRGFDVIGRIRWAWTDGSWNEWMLLFDDGTTGWLGDAMGQFMLLRERPDFTSSDRKVQSGNVFPGHEVYIDEASWTVTDARDVICIAAEGELPFQPRPGYKLHSVDMKRGDGECASLQRDEAGVDFYRGRYVTLAELQPTGLREFEGWERPRYG